MYLKNLTLKGFKSFADTTSIDLEPGVTVVVGPNGSGKSNVVDAIAWVLGSQAPNALRSTKMDDIIFAGTSDKPALGRAEVSLTIDNHCGTLPIDFNEVRISRTLFRSGESEYAINGVSCRLIDVAELLSDGGVGRQQHVIVSQGQIDAVLTSRPADRRAIVEEAAGVLKYRKRKDRAESRLKASESDLMRVKDIIAEVKRQLRPLAKQAEAARQHGDLVEELDARRLHLAGRQISELRNELQAIGEQPIHAQQQSLKAQLVDLDKTIADCENQLGDQSHDDLGALLRRLESMRERARGLAALVAERRRGIDRDRSVFMDRGVVANLESEVTRLRLALTEAEVEAEALTSESATLEASAQELVSDRAVLDERMTQTNVESGNRVAEVRGELGALRVGIATGIKERERSQTRLQTLAERQETLVASLSTQQTHLEELQEQRGRAVAELETTRANQEAVETTLNEELVAEAEAEAAHQRWLARAEALTLALHEAHSRAGAERVAHVKGVLGTLLDLVVIDEGFETAFESAVGAALNAVIVADLSAAHAAFEALSASGSAGAVLALPTLPAPPTEPLAPQGAGARDTARGRLRDHVRGTKKGVDALLDTLIGEVQFVDSDWRTAADRAHQDPTACFVTPSGDFIGPLGWRIGRSALGATAAALAEAEEQVVVAARACTVASARVAAARVELNDRTQSTADCSASLERIESEVESAVEQCQQLDAQRRDCATESEALKAGLSELLARLGREQNAATELESAQAMLEVQEAKRRDEAERTAEERVRIAKRADEIAKARTNVEVRTAAINERENGLRVRIAEIETRLEHDMLERSSAGQQRELLDRRATVLNKLAKVIDARLEMIDSRLSAARLAHEEQSAATRAAVSRLSGLRSERARLNEQAEGLQERLSSAAIKRAELSTKLQAVIDRLRSEHNVAPEVAISAPCPPTDDGIDSVARIEELQNELEIMGPINPLALEESRALQERYEFLEAQLDDITATRRDLTKVIASIDEDIVTIFAGAFADVSNNFEKLFETLFPGGQGSMQLSTPDDLLNTGIEVSARPGGKNVRKLSLLSGGERTLTALAFLFAVFMSRPSPFYVLDEVEVALDDVNLHRFLGLVEEFRADAQLLFVSHQKRTMEIADCLYGVSMKRGGSSTVVSEKVATAISDVA